MRIVIGDIHGCIDEFTELVDVLGCAKDGSALVLVGDLMDRGPDPIGCLHYARHIGATVIKGNHEERHHRYWRHEQRIQRELSEGIKYPKRNPMSPLTGPSKLQNDLLTEDDVRWLEGLPLMIRLSDSCVAVHAGLEPAYRVSAQSNSVLRVRYVDPEGRMKSMNREDNTTYWAETWQGPESVVYGHAIHSLQAPRIDQFPGGACYGIDLGCVFGGHLCALIINDNGTTEFVKVRAKRAYYPMRDLSEYVAGSPGLC